MRRLLAIVIVLLALSVLADNDSVRLNETNVSLADVELNGTAIDEFIENRSASNSSVDAVNETVSFNISEVPRNDTIENESLSAVLAVGINKSLGNLSINESIDVVNETINDAVQKKKVDAVVKDANGQVVDAVVGVLDATTEIIRAQTKEQNEPVLVKSNKVYAVVMPVDGPVEEVEFENVIIDNDDSMTLQFDASVPVDVIGDVRIQQAYAIDPTKMDFDEATVTVVAQGTELYKCKDWKFAERACGGQWVLLRDDLVPGERYTFTLTPADPGFAEGVRTAMRVYSSAGANPTVTAVVTDGVGIGIQGITVNFSASAGVMTPASGVTGPDGTVSSTQSGGALGNSITLESQGLSNVSVTTAAAAALAATSRGIIWLDNQSQKVMTAVITPATNVLVSTAVTPTYTPAAGGTAINPATISMGNTVTQTIPTIASGQIWHNTYQVGDSISVEIATTSPSPDFILTLPRRPEYNLFAYATGGANPTVTAVVMDKNNTAVANATVNFTSSAGMMSVASGLTATNGTLVSTQSGGALGNTINVTGSVGGYVLQPAQIVTAASPAVAASSRVIAWRDPETLFIHVATVSTVSASLNVLTTTGVVTDTNLDRTPMNRVALSSGSFVNQAAPGIGSIRLARGTFGTDDAIQVTVATTTPANDQAVILQYENRTYLESFATSGANPNVTAVVTDAQGLPVTNVTINFSSSAGVMTPSSGVTGVDGTITSVQTGGALADTINVTMGSQVQQIVTSASVAIAAADMVFTWYEELARRLHVASVTRATRVLTTTSATTVTAIDDTPTNQGTIAVTTVLAQTTTRESLMRVAQSTSGQNDLLSIAVGTTTAATDAATRLSEDEPRYLYAFAGVGANPTVTAVVTDEFGNGLSGVNVTFNASAGTMTPSSALTGASGVAQSTQSGGALGNLLNASVDGLNSVTMVSSVAAAVAAADYVYAWYELNGNIARSAAVTRATNVLASGTTTSFVPTDNTPDNGAVISLGSIGQQSTTDPAFVAASGRGNGDTVTISVLTTNPATDAVLILNDTVDMLTQQNTTLSAFATAGANPNVTAVVIDAYGHGVPNVPVSFSATVGVMTPSSGVTGPDGTITSIQSGGSLGNTITVSSQNFSNVQINTAAAVAISATSLTTTWLDAAEVAVRVAVMSSNRVLNSGTITPTFTLFDTNIIDRVSFSVGSTVSQTIPTIASVPVWRRTFWSGDMIFVETPTTTLSPDGIIVMRNDTRNQLFTYATGGANPNVTVVVTDRWGVGVPNVAINLSASAGSISSTAVTGPDGSVTVAQTGGGAGDVIRVTNGVQNATIVTAASPAVSAGARTIVWLDNSTNKVMSATVSTVAASMNVLTLTGVVTVTNTDQTPFNNVTLSSGNIAVQAVNTPGMARVAQGTYGDMDILTINVATTTPTQDGSVILSVNNRTFVDAFATSGANPNVTAFVHDYYGRALQGVTVNFSSSAGVMTPSSAVTDHRGIAQSMQSGGALGNMINVTAQSLNPVQITTATSVAIAAADKVFAVYDPRARMVLIASVTNATNVLTTTSAVTATGFDTSFNPGVLSLNTVVAQTATSPARLEVISVTEQENDEVSLAVATTTAAVDAFVTLPNPTENYLFAYATGGANPTVTAVVADQNGVGVAGVPITFTSSAGVMTPATNTTNSSGIAISVQSGGALGNAINVSSQNLTTVMITTAASVAAVAADTVVSWYDPENELVFAAAVTRATNVLTSAATTNYDVTDNTPNNNATAQAISSTAQSSTAAGFLTLNASTIADGDFVSIFTTTVTPLLDGLVFVNGSTTVPSNLSITKSAFPDPVANGSSLVYTINITNIGGKTAFNVTVQELYAAVVTFVNASPSPTVGNDTWVLGNLSGYASTTINITVNVSSNATQGSVFNNTANGTWRDEAGNAFAANVTINTTVGEEPNLEVTKTDSPDPVLTGSNLLYQITITNLGSGIARNVTLVDTLPAGVSFVNASPANVSSNQWDLGNISSGNSTTVNVTVLVTAGGGAVIVNTANVSFLNSTNGTVSRTASSNTTVISPSPGGGGGGGGGGGKQYVPPVVEQIVPPPIAPILPLREPDVVVEVIEEEFEEQSVSKLADTQEQQSTEASEKRSRISASTVVALSLLAVMFVLGGAVLVLWPKEKVPTKGQLAKYPVRSDNDLVWDHATNEFSKSAEGVEKHVGKSRAPVTFSVKNKVDKHSIIEKEDDVDKKGEGT